jgi:N-acetylglutamate synthase-like GNAT family acetyltransferase
MTGTSPDAIHIRRARGSDEPRLRRLLEELSPDDRGLRFFSAAADATRAAHDAAMPTDGRRALVAETSDGRIVGHGILAGAGTPDAELAVNVAADHRHLGLGGVLMERLAATAWAQGTRRVIAYVVVEHVDMRALLRRRFVTRRRETNGVATEQLLRAVSSYRPRHQPRPRPGAGEPGQKFVLG